MNFFTYYLQEKGFAVALEDFIFSPKANLGTNEVQLPVDKDLTCSVDCSQEFSIRSFISDMELNSIHPG